MKIKKKSIRLGINIDHIATLRQVRGGSTEYPNLLQLAQLAVKSGADQITIHLREDRRHIQVKDLIQLSKFKSIKINLEMAANKDILAYALKYKPAWVCLVPEKRRELTTEGGLDVKAGFKKLNKIISQLQQNGTRVSLFIAPQKSMVKLTQQLHADAIEFHTGHWVLAKGAKKKKLWKDLHDCAELTHSLGMRVHAGHGLDFSTAKQIIQLPFLEEVNIGHSIICYSLETGLEKAIQNMRRALRGET